MTWPTLPAFNTANFLDHFDSSLDSRWTSVTSGTGAVTVTDSYLKCDAPANSAAFVYRNVELDKTKSQLWLICCSEQLGNAGAEAALHMAVVNGASAPAADTAANIVAKTLIRRNFDASDTSIQDEHWNSAGTRFLWDPATPVWVTASFVSSIPDARVDDYYIVGLEIDGVNSRWRLWGIGESFATPGTYEFDQGWRLFSLTDWVTWANTRSNANLWLVLGNPYTNIAVAREHRIEWVRYAEAPAGNGVVDAWVASKTSISASNHRIRHLYSYDGLTFLPEDRTTWALDLGTAGQPDDTELQRPRAVWDGGNTDWLFYTGNDGTTNTVCVAYAAYDRPQNGPWTKYASNPVVTVGGAGQNDDAGAVAGDVVVDLSESDPDKRWKMAYTGLKTSDGKFRIMYATAPAATGPWTKQGTIIDVGGGGSYDEGGAVDPVIVRYGSVWEVWYEAQTSANSVTLRRATGTDLGTLTKDTTDYTSSVVDAKQALTANMNSAPGRTVTVADTTNFAKDAAVVISQSNGGDDYGFSKIRKIVSSTSLELYHGVTGFTTVTPAKIWQRNGGRNRTPRAIVRVGTEWWFYETFWDPWVFAADDGTYGALVEEMYLLTHSGDGPSSAVAVLQQQPSPVALRGFNNDQRSHENMTLLNPPFSTGIAWIRA